MKFEIKEEFYIDGKATRLISGAVHYFRITPGKWHQSLFNLKAMGANTVETYVPWNLHEPRPNEFYFEHLANLEKFIEEAQDLGLYIILRPSPYICAEWEYGGLPAWLLKDHVRIRSQDPKFMSALERYYQELIPRIAKYQYTNGGNVIMVQIENEYGSYSDDKVYLSKQKELMERLGINVPFVTSDGGWKEVLEAGTLMEEDILPTANFGSNAEKNFGALQDFMAQHNVKKPLMCMEFWDGWFNNWGEPTIKRDPFETAEETRKVLEMGSINFYMFHGGTNFGFYNGTSDTPNGNLPQVTSYDYDAPLTESANPTAKYFAIKNEIQKLFPENHFEDPIISPTMAPHSVKVKRKVSLFNTLETISEPIINDVTLPMEELDQNYGYVLYETVRPIQETRMRTKLVEANDRAQIYLNHELIETQYQDSLGRTFEVEAGNKTSHLQVLVENMGRNNYGRYLVAPHQRKGIRSGVMQDLHYISGWKHYPLSLDNTDRVDFDRGVSSGPTFYEFEFDVTEAKDTYLYIGNLGKGSAFLNDFNIGKYWKKGPFHTMFIPFDLLKVGKNKLVLFETEEVEITEIHFSSEPITIHPESID